MKLRLFFYQCFKGMLITINFCRQINFIIQIEIIFYRVLKIFLHIT